MHLLLEETVIVYTFLKLFIKKPVLLELLKGHDHDPGSAHWVRLAEQNVFNLRAKIGRISKMSSVIDS